MIMPTLQMWHARLRTLDNLPRVASSKWQPHLHSCTAHHTPLPGPQAPPPLLGWGCKCLRLSLTTVPLSILLDSGASVQGHTQAET